MSGILNIQIKSELGNKKANLEKVENIIKNNSDKKLDLIVMPEFFSTNIDYLEEPESENGGEVINFIQKLAKKYNTNIIAGSVVRKKDEKLYNTSFAINRQGEIIEKYDKVHLFNYLGGTEGQRITSGNEMKTVQFDFAKVGLIICFDVRYPLFINKIAREDVSIIVMPTAWLVPKEVYGNPQSLKYAQDMFVSMCRVRAYDNSVFWVVSNLVSGKEWLGIGNSMIISPTAEVIANAENDEIAIYAQIDEDMDKHLRAICPIVYQD